MRRDRGGKGSQQRWREAEATWEKRQKDAGRVKLDLVQSMVNAKDVGDSRARDAC